MRTSTSMKGKKTWLKKLDANMDANKYAIHTKLTHRKEMRRNYEIMVEDIRYISTGQLTNNLIQIREKNINSVCHYYSYFYNYIFCHH